MIGKLRLGGGCKQTGIVDADGGGIGVFKSGRVGSSASDNDESLILLVLTKLWY